MNKLALSDDILLKIEKPARYIGGEVNAVVKNKEEVDMRIAFCFPDVYEIGMSHLGIQILYDMFNQFDGVWCERVYSPWADLDAVMREEHIPLFALESQDPIREFDWLAITIQYEMCYTNILQVLDLSRIPLLSKDRTDEDPIVIGGGPCTYNPEPIADFFDLFYIGEGETRYAELVDLYRSCRDAKLGRREFLRRAAKIPGMYVPAFYQVNYREDGTIAAFTPTEEGIPSTILKEIQMDVSHTYYPKKPLVPFMRTTQDRVVLEIMRGCIRGCRFCQAGQLYRPVRERSLEMLKEYAVTMLKNTGQEEISLSSLSSSDYTRITELLEKMLVEYGIDEFNGPQGRILYVLWNRDSISIQALADGTGLANATLTSMLDRMERRQLVKRLPAPGDRRKTLIALTPKARVLEQKYRAVSERMNELIYQGFSAEEAAQLEAYLERVLDNVRRAEIQQNNLKK